MPSTVIGADHSTEHQNRIMKVLGGIKGIANDINKLDKYFTIAPEINHTIPDFCEAFESKITTLKELNTTSWLVIKANELNMQKLDEPFKTHNANFDESDSVFNDVTKKLLHPKLAEEFLTHETIGKELLENFIKEGFEWEISIWDPITKRKLPTFGNNVKTVK